MHTLWQDVRYSIRTMAKSPAFTAVAVITLALGIGSNTAIFSVIEAVMLRPFSFPHQDRLIRIWETNTERNITKFTSSALNYLSWQQQTETLAELGAWQLESENRSDGGTAERVASGRASSALFRALEMQPVHGRFFLPAEDQPGNRFVAVLGYEYWRGNFDHDPDAVGRTIVLNGETYTIVGIAPPLNAPFRVDVWRPLAPSPEQENRGNHMLYVVGRLKPGITITAAESALRTIASRLAEQFPDTNRGWSLRAETLYESVVGPETRQALLVLLAAVGVLLLIACANVANLLLARSSSRLREIAVRQALGAGRARILAQALTESVILGLIGGAGGVGLAVWGIELLRPLFPGTGIGQAAVDERVLAFSFLLSLVTGVVFGLAPALQASRASLETHLKESGRGTSASAGHHRLRHALVVAEIALALVLLTCAGLLLRSFDQLRRVPLGFNPERLITAKVSLQGEKYEDFTNFTRFLGELIASVNDQPGVRAAGVASEIPFGSGQTSMEAVPEKNSGPPERAGTQAQWRVIGGDFFRAMEIPLLRGRLFEARDDDDSQRVTIINQDLANRLWPGEDPIGKRMLIGDSRSPFEVAGVVADTRDLRIESDVSPVMYFHYRQFGWLSMTLAVRASGDAGSLIAGIRSEVQRLDPELPVYSVRPMEQIVEQASARSRFNSSLLAVFALVALVLASIGIYGVMSYAVEQRTNEIGIRVALGARPADVLRMMVGRGLWLAAIGVAIGLAGAFGAARLLAGLLFGVSPTDAATFVCVPLALAAVAALACYIPARRAARIDPISALRYE